MEVFLDPDKDLLGEETPVILTHFNLSKAIRETVSSSTSASAVSALLSDPSI
ncbi:hypothetical protein ISN45_Aa04g019080, partial [Arabidopsis thaliana x Arabidopsis arenosa]